MNSKLKAKCDALNRAHIFIRDTVPAIREALQPYLDEVALTANGIKKPLSQDLPLLPNGHDLSAWIIRHRHHLTLEVQARVTVDDYTAYMRAAPVNLATVEENKIRGIYIFHAENWPADYNATEVEKWREDYNRLKLEFSVAQTLIEPFGEFDA